MGEGFYTITADAITPLTTAITANVAVLVPAAIGITIVVIAAQAVPKLFKRLIKA